MNAEVFKNVLSQIKPFTDYIYFHVKGEPLMHPEIDKFLDISHEKGFKVNITTNGTLIRETAEKLLNKPALRQVNFSLHSIEGYEEDRREDYLKSVFKFAKEASRAGILISLRLWNLNREVKRRDKNSEILGKIEKEFNLIYKIEKKSASERGVKIAERIYLNEDFLFEWPSLDKEEDTGKGYCLGLKDQAAVLADGTVVPCCLDSEGVINLGNILKTPFDRILGSERALRLRSGFSKREGCEELCRKCGFKKRFD